MSLWWMQRDQLDDDQVQLIEDLSLRESHLVRGPPGSGKTNVLLRRAQYVRSQQMPNVLVLTFTRSLVEFVKTGCFDDQGREIFPPNCVSTLESWIRGLYRTHKQDIPDEVPDLMKWKTILATGALNFIKAPRVRPYDALFVDEAQDLLAPEVELLRQWSKVLFFVGDASQKIYASSAGLPAAEKIVPRANHKDLHFHYRMAPEICQMADRILSSGSGSLAETCHYKGPKPGRIEINGPLSPADQLSACAARLRSQIRVYGDLIKRGDRLGVIVAQASDRDEVLRYLESDRELAGKSKIVRAKEPTAADRHYDPSFDDEHPINILTLNGCKGIEFRAVHWLFCERLRHHHDLEHYYTLVTRAKTSLHITYTGQLPDAIARSYSTPGKQIW